MTMKELREAIAEIPDEYIACIQCFGEFNEVIVDTVDDIEVKEKNKVCVIMGEM